MAKKGKAKNGNNKAKHSRLMAQKKNKLKREAETRKAKLKEINARINAGNVSAMLDTTDECEEKKEEE